MKDLRKFIVMYVLTWGMDIDHKGRVQRDLGMPMIMSILQRGSTERYDDRPLMKKSTNS